MESAVQRRPEWHVCISGDMSKPETGWKIWSALVRSGDGEWRPLSFTDIDKEHGLYVGERFPYDPADYGSVVAGCEVKITYVDSAGRTGETSAVKVTERLDLPLDDEESILMKRRSGDVMLSFEWTVAGGWYNGGGFAEVVR